MDVDEARADPVRASLERGLGAQYRILRLLGRGGMGAVYLAREEALERLVAIKVLRGETAPAADGRERFRREARTAAQLTHPNIVPLLSFGEVDGVMYLVMGYVRGEPLSARLRRDGRLVPDEARRVVADIAEALDYAHRKGVVHRDVKPDNIVIEDETGRAVLTDFGIAKAWSGGQTVTQAGGIVGTPHYMSPEQVGGEELDGRSDIYSLGVVAFALLSGHLPFEGGAPQDVLVRRLADEAPPLGAIAKDVPEDLVAAVARCLRRDREERWPDARSLREAVAPTSLEAEQLPEPLDTLDGAGPFLLPFALVCAAALLAAFLTGGDYSPQNSLLALLVVLPGGFFLMQVPILSSAARAARARGFTWGQIAGAFLRQPEWWVCLWYPRRFRRVGDVWERLPRSFRVWRVLVTCLVLDVLLAIFLLVFTASPRALKAMEALGVTELGFLEAVGRILAFATVAFPSLALAMAATAVVCARDMRRRGFDVYTLRRVSRTLLNGPTSRRGLWKKPEIAQVLLPLRVATKPRTEPRTPRELLEGLAQAARELTGAALPAGQESVSAARHLVALIEAADAEMVRLSRDADPTEAARLGERLASLEGADAPESRQMRVLLAQQIALYEQMGARLDAARAHREGLVGRLRELWRRALELGAAGAPTEAARRLRALCSEVDALGPPETGPAPEDRTATKTR